MSYSIFLSLSDLLHIVWSSPGSVHGATNGTGGIVSFFFMPGLYSTISFCLFILFMGRAQKNWCFWTMELEKTFKSLLDSKEIKPVNPKGNQPWMFIGRTDAEAEALILWPPDVNSWLIRKDPDAGKDWRQEEKGMIEDEMVGWHHWLNGHEFEQTPGDSEGQGSLACCNSWGHKGLDMT